MIAGAIWLLGRETTLQQIAERVAKASGGAITINTTNGAIRIGPTGTGDVGSPAQAHVVEEVADDEGDRFAVGNLVQVIERGADGGAAVLRFEVEP